MPTRFKTGEDTTSLDDGQFEALVSVFGNKDSYGDVVMPGAFADTLDNWSKSGSPIPVYWSHRLDDPDYNIGSVLDAKENDAGLWVKAQLDLDNPKGVQTYKLLKSRRVKEFSFSYAIDDSVLATKDGQDVQELRKLSLYEVGPTPIGANPATELQSVKSLYRKTGRVISSKNENRLTQAADLISQVLAELSTDEPKSRTRSTIDYRDRLDGYLLDLHQL
jgi:HK97 family phage prohead protease